MTKFAIINWNGDAETDLSPGDAARIILYDDGRDYEIRREDHGFALWTRQQVANKNWTRTMIFSTEETATLAETDIFAEVLRDDARWAGHSVMTMPNYEKMLSENAE